MDSTRQNKISRLLQKELGTYFQREALRYKGKMITVTQVRVTSDLSLARVYISIFPASNDKQEILNLINLENRSIRHFLAQIVKNQLRKTPDLQFFLDDSLDYAERIDELLS